MDINQPTSKWLALALLALGVVSGCCCQAVPLPGENQCPTDARRLYLSCGEEAVRRCPCGPDHNYYGLKPTCWRKWPDGWGCGQMGCSPYPDDCACGDAVSSCGEPIAEPVCDEPAHAEPDRSNPFRNGDVLEEPLPQPAQVESPRTNTAPALTAPAPLVQPQQAPVPIQEKAPAVAPPTQPVQPKRTTMPRLEAPPSEPSPSENPPAKLPTIQNPTITPAPTHAPPVDIAPPATKPVEAPPATKPAEAPPARITPLELTPPPTAPAAKPSAESPPAEPPPLLPPQDLMRKSSSKKPKPVDSNGNELSERVEQHLNNNLQL